MRNYIIDVNLPYYFKIWKTEEYIHQMDIDPKAKDEQIWEYAKQNNLTIITKDSDFSNRILVSLPPPKIIHIKFGNLNMNEFHSLISNNWLEVLKLSKVNKLVNVYKDSLEGIE